MHLFIFFIAMLIPRKNQDHLVNSVLQDGRLPGRMRDVATLETIQSPPQTPAVESCLDKNINSRARSFYLKATRDLNQSHGISARKRVPCMPSHAIDES